MPGIIYLLVAAALIAANLATHIESQLLGFAGLIFINIVGLVYYLKDNGKIYDLKKATRPSTRKTKLSFLLAVAVSGFLIFEKLLV
jgi:hypothetical protein